jgi:hypothetical protein
VVIALLRDAQLHEHGAATLRREQHHEGDPDGAVSSAISSVSATFEPDHPGARVDHIGHFGQQPGRLLVAGLMSELHTPAEPGLRGVLVACLAGLQPLLNRLGKLGVAPGRRGPGRGPRRMAGRRTSLPIRRLDGNARQANGRSKGGSHTRTAHGIVNHYPADQTSVKIIYTTSRDTTAVSSRALPELVIVPR